jgi:hypothetical protein
MVCAGSASSHLIPGAVLRPQPPEPANSLSGLSHAAGFPAASMALNEKSPLNFFPGRKSNPVTTNHPWGGSIIKEIHR